MDVGATTRSTDFPWERRVADRSEPKASGGARTADAPDPPLAVLRLCLAGAGGRGCNSGLRQRVRSAQAAGLKEGSEIVRQAPPDSNAALPQDYPKAGPLAIGGDDGARTRDLWLDKPSL